MKWLMWVMILCLAAPSFGSEKNSQRARNLNTQGYSLYKEGKFTEALKLFREAVQADSEYALAHYNLACTASIVWQKRTDPCAEEGLPGEMYVHLKETLRLNPKKVEKMRKDPDLSPFHQHADFMILTGQIDPGKKSDVIYMLQKFPWEADHGGVKSKVWSLEFTLDNRFSLSVEGEKKAVGVYEVKTGTISVKFDSAFNMYGKPVRSMTGELNENGTLIFTADNGEQLSFSNHLDSSCSA